MHWNPLPIVHGLDLNLPHPTHLPTLYIEGLNQYIQGDQVGMYQRYVQFVTVLALPMLIAHGVQVCNRVKPGIEHCCSKPTLFVISNTF